MITPWGRLSSCSWGCRYLFMFVIWRHRIQNAIFGTDLGPSVNKCYLPLCMYRVLEPPDSISFNCYFQSTNVNFSLIYAFFWPLYYYSGEVRGAYIHWREDIVFFKALYCPAGAPLQYLYMIYSSKIQFSSHYCFRNHLFEPLSETFHLSSCPFKATPLHKPPFYSICSISGYPEMRDKLRLHVFTINEV